jgi:hypothetical protein
MNFEQIFFLHLSNPLFTATQAKTLSLFFLRKKKSINKMLKNTKSTREENFQIYQTAFPHAFICFSYLHTCMWKTNTDRIVGKFASRNSKQANWTNKTFACLTATATTILNDMKFLLMAFCRIIKFLRASLWFFWFKKKQL